MNQTEAFLNDWKKSSNEINSVNKSSTTRSIGNMVVELTKSASDDYTIRINHMLSTKRKKGELKKFMKRITQLADTHEVTLTMAAQPTGRYDEDIPDKNKLKNIAESYGFDVKFEYPDGLGYEMVRPHHPEEWKW